jgi:hypothetical protein
MGLMDTIRKAIRGSKDPQVELDREVKQAEMEAQRRDELMKVNLPPSDGPRR